MSDVKEAVILLAKCAESHKTYGLRAEKHGKDNWLVTWAFPIKESSAKNEGYDKTAVKGNIAFSAEYPGCPYCGGRELALCSCGHLNCTIVKNGVFTCEWCGNKGQIGAYGGEAITADMDV
jgi:hypothetical protein